MVCFGNNIMILHVLHTVSSYQFGHLQKQGQEQVHGAAEGNDMFALGSHQ